MAASTKSLFQAIKPKSPKDALQGIMGFPEQKAPTEGRDPLDYDPTPPSATQAVLREELPHILKHGSTVWETAVGAGHIANVLTQHGLTVLGNDVVDRGWPGVELRSFLDCNKPRSKLGFTNPPYNLISARDGHCRWIKHSLALGMDYIALLLNADWPCARINGMDQLLEDHPPSVEYRCTWKIDFRGLGAPPQRNSWFIWDTNRPAPQGGGWISKRLYKEVEDPRQEVLL